VKFPGEYRIRKGETLSDVIKRAGGFTDNASPESAVLSREAVAALEAERAAQFARDIQTTFATRLLTEETTTQGMAEISQIVSSLQAVEGAGRLLIDLPAAMSGDLDADLEVEDGDRIVIPVLSNTVSVVGEVKRQGTHSFQGELTLDDYIDLSAGFTRRADDGGIYIVKANGSVVTLEKNLWRFTGNNRSLDPGDTIVVPINTQYKESLASWREITQIVYQSMVSVAAVAAL
jgi:polysaccharide export outer membrane protein